MLEDFVKFRSLDIGDLVILDSESKLNNIFVATTNIFADSTKIWMVVDTAYGVTGTGHYQIHIQLGCPLTLVRISTFWYEIERFKRVG